MSILKINDEKERNSKSLFNEILGDLCSPKSLSGLSTGFVISLILIIMQFSFASLLFSGPLEIHLQKGMGMFLSGALIMLIYLTLFSSIKTMVTTPQDAPVALFAGVGAAIVVALGSAGDEAFMTITISLMLSCLLTGLCFFFIGKYGLAEIFRFMPYPVIGGFLAGTGYLLAIGGLEVMTGLSLSIQGLIHFFSLSYVYLWVPGVIFALLLFLSLQRFSHFLLLPGALVFSTFLYHLALFLLRIPLEEAIDMGLFFESFTTGVLWPVFNLGDFRYVEWGLLLQQIPAIMTISFISLLGLLLNTNGIELSTKREISMSHELKVNGIANILAGLSGCHPGYNTLSLTVLGFKVNANTRLVGLTAALLMGITLFFGSRFLSFFPKTILGSFLFLLGLFFLNDWLLETRKKMPALDYLILWSILLIICIFGFIQGVLYGIIITVVLFVVRFSQIPLLRSIHSGSKVHSLKGRSLPQQHLLGVYGQSIIVIELEGYIFFGSVTTLINHILEVLKKDQPIPIEYIIFDCAKVNGFDVSAINNFVRLFNRFSAVDQVFVFARPPSRFEALLREHLGDDTSSYLRFFPDLDSALQWSEDQVIEREETKLVSLSKEAREAKDRLFQGVYEDLYKDLGRREQIESLFDDLKEYLVYKEHQKGEVILSEDGEALGLYMVETGIVVEILRSSQGQETEIRSLGPASIFAELGAYGKRRYPLLYRAKTDVRLGLLTPQALISLEEENPALSVRAHRLVIEHISEQTFPLA